MPSPAGDAGTAAADGRDSSPAPSRKEEKPAAADAPPPSIDPDSTPAEPGEPGEEEEEEEEETCGFCRFMKAGPCRDVFVAWEKCVDTNRGGGGDFVEACLPSTQGLKLCMEANPEYYGPLLDGGDEDGEGKQAGPEEAQRDGSAEGAATPAAPAEKPAAHA